MSAGLAELAELGVATCHEAMGGGGLCAPYLRPIYPGARIAGPAVTALCPPGDNLHIHEAVDGCRPGDVLVVATTSLCSDGMFGELLAVALRARGGVGLVIDAGVRDVADLTQMRLPVWSRFVHAQGTRKHGGGAVGVPVVVAGVLVHPGDVVVADDDGVLVVPRDRVAEVARRGRERAAREAQARQRLAAGESGLDVHGLRGAVARGDGRRAA